jgi:hypothetical protein
MDNKHYHDAIVGTESQHDIYWSQKYISKDTKKTDLPIGQKTLFIPISRSELEELVGQHNRESRSYKSDKGKHKREHRVRCGSKSRSLKGLRDVYDTRKKKYNDEYKYTSDKSSYERS